MVFTLKWTKTKGAIMESILNELYYTALEKDGYAFACLDKQVGEQEHLAREKLKEALTEEQWSAFVVFLDRYADRRDVEMQNAYQYGFRQGLVLAIESFYKSNR